MNLLKKAIYDRVSKWGSPGRNTRQNGGYSRQAGIPVTYENALTYSAIWRSVNLISQSIATLPWTVNQRKMQAGGKVKRERILNHPANNVLNLMSNDEMSTQAWIETMVAWALTWGNGYSEIERDGANRPVALWPLDPERVTPDRDDDHNLIYVVKNKRGREDTVLKARDVYHLKGLGFDGLVGYSVIGHAAKTIGMGLATEQFGAAFFENGASFNGVFSHPNTLGDAAIDNLRDSLAKNHGGPQNSLKPLILEEGMTWAATSIPPNDAQFLETRKFTVAEVARWYGIPLHKLMEMDQSTFNNIEHQSIEFVQDALVPWIRRLEIEADIKLVSPAARGRVYTKLNVNSLLRGDMASRDKHYKTMMNLGVYNINEVRAFEDENPIGKDGEKRLVQTNQTTLEKIGTEEPKPAAPPPPTAEPPEPGEAKEGAEGEEPETPPQQKVLIEAIARSTRREVHRAVDALSRYDGDRDGLLAWMNKFYTQHAEYMLTNLTTPLEAVTAEADLPAFIDRHVLANRLAVLDAFDNDGELVFTPAEDEARDLLGGGL